MCPRIRRRRYSPPLVAFLVSMLGASASAQIFMASQDTYSSAVSPVSNFGSDPEIRVKSGSREGYWFFDLGSLAGGTVTQATLSVHVQAFFRASDPFTVHEVLAPWDESVLTHDNRPPINPTPIAIVDPPGTGSFAVLDVTSLVAQWVANPATNHGLAILPPATGMKVFFSTRESGVPAELDIEFIGGAKPNFATVEKSGGDYGDPIAAMNDIDNWCENGGFQRPICRLLIGSGTFVLSETLSVPDNVEIIGADRSGSKKTELVTEPGVEDAILFLGGSLGYGLVSDLSIKNIAGSLGHSSGIRATELFGFSSPSVTVQNVAVEVSGGAANTGIRLGIDVTLLDVDVVVKGGTDALGIFSVCGKADSVRVTVEGGNETQTARGWEEDAEDCRSPTFSNFIIEVRGGLSQVGFQNESDREPSIATNGKISVFGSDGIGLLSGDNVHHYSDLAISAATGIVVTQEGGVVLDGVIVPRIDNISDSRIALRLEPDGVAVVTNSSLSGEDYGVLMSATSPSRVTVDGSTVTGGINSILGDAQSEIAVGSSKLVGPVHAGGGAIVCTGVYDGSYLPVTCL